MKALAIFVTFDRKISFFFSNRKISDFSLIFFIDKWFLSVTNFANKVLQEFVSFPTTIHVDAMIHLFPSDLKIFPSFLMKLTFLKRYIASPITMYSS